MSVSCINTSADRCPLCGTANECQLASAAPYKGLCWCQSAEVSTEVLGQLPPNLRGVGCLCRKCLQPASTNTAACANVPAAVSADHYTDELGRVVFTAEYLRSRGWCCGNGCRHCPF